MANSARDFAECQAPIPLIVISEHEEILNPLDPIPPRKKPVVGMIENQASHYQRVLAMEL